MTPAFTLLHASALATLTVAAILDVCSRQIPNRFWLIAAGVLTPIRVLVEVQDPSGWPAVAWGLGLTAAAFLFWRLDVWGGADAKGAMLLAWTIPPVTLGAVHGHPLLYSIPASLALVLAWQRFRSDPAPFYAFLAPTTALVFLGLIIIW